MKRRHSRLLLGLLALILLVLGIAFWPTEPPLGSPEATGIAGASGEAVLRKALPIPESKEPVVLARKPRGESPRAQSPTPPPVVVEAQAQPEPQELASPAPAAPVTEFAVLDPWAPALRHGAQISYAFTIFRLRARIGGEDAGPSIPDLGYFQERCVLVADVGASFRRGPAREELRTFERATVDGADDDFEGISDRTPTPVLEPGLTSPWIGRLLRKTLAGTVIDASPALLPRPPDLPATISGKGWGLGMHALLPEWPLPIGERWDIQPTALLHVLAPADDLAWVRTPRSEHGTSSEQDPSLRLEDVIAWCIPGGRANQAQLGKLEGKITAERDGWMDLDDLRLERARIRIDVTGRSEDATLAQEFMSQYPAPAETITARVELSYSIRGGGLYAWDTYGRRAPLTELHCEMDTRVKWTLEGPTIPGSFEFSCQTTGQLAFLGGIVERNAAIWETLKDRDPRFLKDESYVLVK